MDNQQKKMNLWVLLGLSLLLTYSVMILGSLCTAYGMGEWYNHLNRPTWTPAPIVFQVVWPTLYTLMGFSFFLALRANQGSPKSIVFSFCTQLFFNLLWSFLFFTLHSPLLALIDIALLSTAILWTICVFFQVSKLSAYLLVPYLIWVIFAGILNAEIYLKNI